MKNNNIEVYEFTRENKVEVLDEFISDCDFIFHLAGVNRPKNEVEFQYGNTELTKILLKKMTNNEKSIPILFTSSIQIESLWN